MPLPKSFIHFGCWGEPKRHRKDNSKLFNAIQKNTVDFYTVAGDNYYPQSIKKDKKDEKDKKDNKKEKNKKNKKKNILIEEISQLFHHLIQLAENKKPIYILFGNHEILDINVENNACQTLIREIDLMNLSDNIRYFQNIMVQQMKHSIVIMIDTTIYEKDEDKLKKE